MHRPQSVHEDKTAVSLCEMDSQNDGESGQNDRASQTAREENHSQLVHVTKPAGGECVGASLPPTTTQH